MHAVAGKRQADEQQPVHGQAHQEGGQLDLQPSPSHVDNQGNRASSPRTTSAYHGSMLQKTTGVPISELHIFQQAAQVSCPGIPLPLAFQIGPLSSSALSHYLTLEPHLSDSSLAGNR